MGHDNCSRCNYRIPSSIVRKVKTSQPELWEKIVALRYDLQHGVRICDRCAAQIRRSYAKLSLDVATADENLENLNSVSAHDQSNQSVEGPSSPQRKKRREEPTCATKPNENRLWSEWRESQLQDSEEPTSHSLTVEWSELNWNEPDVATHTDGPVELLREQCCNKGTQTNQTSSKITVTGFSFVSRTEKFCFVCTTTPARSRIPEPARIGILIKDNVYIAPGNRCCQAHLGPNGQFNEEARALILKKSTKTKDSLPIEEYSLCLQRVIRHLKSERGLVDFDSVELRDEDYKFLTGITRAQFDTVLSYVEQHLYRSKHRSPKNALGIVLMKIRQGLTHEMLGFLFRMPLQRISVTIDTVTDLLAAHFVPQYLGYSHISREAVRENQTPNFVLQLYKADPGSIVLILDGTYLFLTKSEDFEFQRATYNLPKCRNLAKPMMIVTPNGYILESEGPYKSNAANNDAGILNQMLKSKDGIMKFVKPGDHFVLDRGFLKSVPELEAKRIKVHMPAFLKKDQKQFTTEEANATRMVTMTRWVVESVNGRLKHVFRLFGQTLPTSYVFSPRLKNLWRIACALSNAFFPPLYHDMDKHAYILDAVEARLTQNNELRQLVEENQWARKNVRNWKKVEHQTFTDFPRLTEQNLFEITLGSYQLRNASLYIKQHFAKNPDFELKAHAETPNIIRAQIHSRFHSGEEHLVWVGYDPNKQGSASILKYYCTCKTGSRTLGCCSHITTVIWFMGYYRHVVAGNRQTLRQAYLKDAAESPNDVIEDVRDLE